METYEPQRYGEAIADVYDTWYRLPDATAACETLAALADGGRALELGIGTGRVALPLAARGVEVHGIEASPAMVDQLRAKPGGRDIPVSIGDFADVAVDGEFALVFVVFNTLFMLPSQEHQVRCFENVFVRLRPGGRFAVEAFVPDVSRFVRDQHLGVNAIDDHGVRLDAWVYDPQQQSVHNAQLRISEHGTRVVRTRLRFAYPSELDLMARLAGFELEHRWGSFARDPFTADAAFAVSVYRKP